MDYLVRGIEPEEWPLLEGFLYEAIWAPEGFQGEVPRSIVRDDPKCRAAWEGFGMLPDDRAVVAEVAGVVVGACWARAPRRTRRARARRRRSSRPPRPSVRE